MRPSPVIARWVLAAYVVVPIVLVLGPLPNDLFDATVDLSHDAADTLLGPGHHPRRMLVEGVANVLMFVPIGLLLPLALPRTSLVRLFGGCVLAACLAELTQALVLSNRHPSVRDVALNALGAAIGLAVTGRRGRRVRSPRAASLGSGP